MTARQELVKEEGNHNDKLLSVEAKIFIGLTDGEALCLGSRHNLNGHLTHKMTHRDDVRNCMEHYVK